MAVFVCGGKTIMKDKKSGVKFGIWIPPFPSWSVIKNRVQQIESLGFDSIFMVDHFAHSTCVNSPWMEAWTLLAGMAACTSCIKVGTLVTNFIYRNPALLAKQALTLENISGGRLILGIGAGSPQDLSHPMTGVDPWPNPERVSRFEEIVTILDQMLSNPVSTYTGKYYKVKGAVMLPPPVQQPRPPLMIAAQGPRMLKIAASYADNWNSLVGFKYSSVEALGLVRDNNKRISEMAIAQGRDPEDITRSFAIGMTVDKPFQSIAAFQDFICRYIEVGIEEFMLGYWLDDDIPDPIPLEHINSLDLLERIAVDVLPEYKRLE
jgi:alkanesulfonate monooxygenase SsuD/methylene tetrahydromethanopterin reductase-like flavin-dependent oxidoreductase (luciferase family)